MKKLVRMRRKKPAMIRLEHVRGKVKENWHKPKGKFGRRKKVLKNCKGEVPRQGRSMPKSLKGLHPSGLKIFEVENVNQLKELDPKVYGVKLKDIGNKKKIAVSYTHLTLPTKRIV